MNPLQQVLYDIQNAQSVDLLGQIYGYAATAFAADPATLQQVAAACQARDAQLRQGQPFQPAAQLQPPVAPLAQGAQRHGAEVPENFPGSFAPPSRDTRPPEPSVQPVSSTPPGWMANASAIGLGVREAAGVGGLPALDSLRVALVDLTCAAWDCGLDLSQIEGLRDVQKARPEDCWKISCQMLDRIRVHLQSQR
jgi:hypothetical protein